MLNMPVRGTGNMALQQELSIFFAIRAQIHSKREITLFKSIYLIDLILCST